MTQDLSMSFFRYDNKGTRKKRSAGLDQNFKFLCKRHCQENEKDNVQSGRKYLQILSGKSLVFKVHKELLQHNFKNSKYSN